MKIVRALLIAVVLAFAVALPIAVAPVFAGSGFLQTAPTTPMDITAFLQWLVGGGGSVLAVSWILERMPWFQSLSSSAKDYTIFGVSVAVGCGALAVIRYVPPDVIAAIAPFFLVVASVFAMVFIAKTFHKADKIGPRVE